MGAQKNRQLQRLRDREAIRVRVSVTQETIRSLEGLIKYLKKTIKTIQDSCAPHPNKKIEPDESGSGERWFHCPDCGAEGRLR